MKAVKGKFKEGSMKEEMNESYAEKKYEGDVPSPVSRPGPMSKSGSLPGSKKLATSDEPGEVTWSPMAKQEKSGNMKIPTHDDPGPVSYPVSSGKPSEHSSMKVPFSELGAKDPEVGAEKMESGVAAAGGNMPSKKRPLKKYASKY